MMLMMLETLRAVMVALRTSSSHNRQPSSLVHNMTTQLQTNPEEKLVSIKITSRNKRRLALLGYTGQTYNQTLQGVLDKVETCSCHGPRRLTR
jgi:hypothetical protein